MGVILYNDPEDYIDFNFANATRSDTFPNSIYLPGSGAQRGTLIRTEGDPLTPKLPSLGMHPFFWKRSWRENVLCTLMSKL